MFVTWNTLLTYGMSFMQAELHAVSQVSCTRKVRCKRTMVGLRPHTTPISCELCLPAAQHVIRFSSKPAITRDHDACQELWIHVERCTCQRQHI